MSDNYAEETAPVFKLLKQEAFRLVIVFHNHLSLAERLETEVRHAYPERKARVIDCRKATYEEFLPTYEGLKSGFIFMHHFEDVLSLEANSEGVETGEISMRNNRKRGLTAGLNLRRDRLAKYPIAIFIFIGPYAEDLKSVPLLHRMPDLWSFRSITLDLVREQVPLLENASEDVDPLTGRQPRESPIELSSIGGNTESEKRKTIFTIRSELEKVPATEVALRLSLQEQLVMLHTELGEVEEANRIRQQRNQVVRSRLDGEVLALATDLRKLGPKDSSIAVPISNFENEDRRKVPHHLTIPPVLPETFIGREAELANIHGRLFSGHSFLVLVNGEGGVGKTSLAATYYHRYHAEYQHVAWVLSEKSIVNALLTLARPLGVDFEPQSTAAERLPILLKAMAELENPCLLVIDNADEIEDLEANDQHLRRITNFHVLLTSRATAYRPRDVVKVEGLPLERALELFKGYYPSHQAAEDGLFREIYDAIAGNTLVIELIAKNLALSNALDVQYRLEDLLRDLQGKGVLQLRHTPVVSTDYHGEANRRKAMIQDIVAAMYDLGELPDAEKAVLSVFAVLPAERIEYRWLQQLLSAEDLKPTLLALAQKGWLDYQADSASFKVSPVVQQVTRKQNAERLFADCSPLLDALNDKMAYDEGGNPSGSGYEDAAYYARLGEHIVSCFSEPKHKVGILCERIGRFHQTMGDLLKALFFYEAYQKIAEGLCAAFPENAGFKNGLAVSYSKLGNTQTALGDLGKALGYYEDDLRLTKELHEAFPSNVAFKNGLAVSYSKLGNTQTALGDLGKALGYYEEFLKLMKELHEAFPSNVAFKNGLAISYEKLGDTQTALGDLDKALGYYETETRLFEELHEAFPSNVAFKNGLAISYSKLGDTQTALGGLGKALGYYEEYLRLRKELHEAFPSNVSFKNGLAVSYTKLGQFFEEVDPAESRNFFLQAKQLWTKLVDAFPAYVEFSRNLNVVNLALGEL